MKLKKILAVSAAAAVLLAEMDALTACGKKKPNEETELITDAPVYTTEAPDENTPEETTAETPASPAGIDPLTGKTGYDTAKYGDKKAVAIVVENHPSARPQWGMSKPDVLFEYEVEGGISRMLWLFSNLDEVPEKVGPVRSLRHDVYEIALGYDVLLVHCGSSNSAREMFPTYAGSYSRIDANATTAFTYRDQTRDVAYEHKLVLLGDKLRSYVANNGIGTTIREDCKNPFRFASADAPFVLNAGSCSSLHYEFSGSYTYTFNYNSGTGTYDLNINGYARKDADGVQCSYKNAIILYVDMVDLHDSSKHQDLLLENGGSGIFATNGTYTDVTWKKDGVTGMLKMYGPDGTELVLNAGNTYIGLVRSTQRSKTSIG